MTTLVATAATLPTLVVAPPVGGPAAPGNSIDIAWRPGYTDAPAILTQATGRFHTWQDCGLTAQSLMGVSNLDEIGVGVRTSSGAIKRVSKAPLGREQFIRNALAAGYAFDDAADPRVGDAFLIVIPESEGKVSGYRYHWATVIMKRDSPLAANRIYVTIENGARSAANEMTCAPRILRYGGLGNTTYPTFHSTWLNHANKRTVIVARLASDTRPMRSLTAPAHYVTKKWMPSVKGAFRCTACGVALKLYSYTTVIPGPQGRTRKRIVQGLG